MKLLLLFAALFCTCKAECGIHELPMIFFMDQQGTVCRVSRLDGWPLTFCKGSCASSVAFSAVSNSSEVDQLSNADRAFSVCRGVQDCCRGVGTATLQAHELVLIPENCELPSSLVSMPSSCYCSPCHPTNTNPSLLHPDSCKVQEWILSLTPDEQWRSPYYWQYSACSVVRREVTLNVPGCADPVNTGVEQGTCESGVDRGCTSTTRNQFRHCRSYDATVREWSISRSYVLTQCPSYAGYGIRFMYADITHCICS